MTSKIPATATMLVKNSERYLSEVLTALDGFDEILLLDNGSTDRTLEIAAGFKNTSIRKHEFIGFGPMKNLAARLARNDWIFNIDSDEVADAELMESIRAAVAENRMQKVFSLSRLNHYDGRLIKACGWYPDIIPRLYHRRFTQFSDRQVHESLKLPENTEMQMLAGRLKHYSFENAEGLIRKMQQYSTLYAEENRYKKPASPAKALLHGGVSFVKNYFLKRGFAYGSDGLIISAGFVLQIRQTLRTQPPHHCRAGHHHLQPSGRVGTGAQIRAGANPPARRNHRCRRRFGTGYRRSRRCVQTHQSGSGEAFLAARRRLPRRRIT